MEVTQENISKMVELAMVNIMTDLVDKINEGNEKYENALSEQTKEMINVSVDMLLAKMTELYADNSMNVMFIKNVLYNHKLTDEKMYEDYKARWYALNSNVIYTVNTDSNNS